MKENIVKKLEFLKKKKEEYIAQVVSLNGAIQAMEELLALPEAQPEIVMEPNKEQTFEVIK